MAADRSRLAAALAYKQAEDERRRRMMESVPVPGAEMPAPTPTQNFRRDLENLSIGIGEGLTRQLEGVKGIVTDPIGAAKGAYEGVKAVVRDPAIIADALRYTAEKARSGPLGAGEVIGEMIGPRKTGPVMAELDVYHGTPHRFPATEANPLGEFDASKIGTGEGAQAYGHGIYLAENPRVAGEYQKMEANVLQSPVRTFKGQELQAGSPQYHAATLVDSMGLNKARKEVANWIATADPRMAREIEGWKQTLDTLNAASGKTDFKTTASKGSLYKADLPDEMIDRMLDWDKPLSEQPAAVKEALRKSPFAPDESVWSHWTGQQLYEAEVRALTEFDKLQKGPSRASVSDVLKNAGIPGIKYLDAGSRGQGGSGTRNFVVFPGEEKKVRILERDGKKVAEMLQRTAPASAQVEVDIYPLRSDPNTLYLSKIAVPKDQRGQGLGSQAMQEIIDKADAEGKRVVLSPSTEYGATSVGRLKDFYKRFGFVENKGRNKNYAISESMYRDPKKLK